MNYTKEQGLAVTLRHKDILVSAGAGAGKTRVLVDRIVGLILDEEEPVDLSELLVLTFTNAAAAEMKERIRVSLEELRMNQPGNYRLARQIRKVKNADISTVHSFCGKLLRSYFQELGIDPSFRIGEEGEMKLIQSQVMEELLEETYAEENPDFLRFVEAYIPGKEDGKLEEMIQNLFVFSNNFPNRKQWFIKKQEEACSLADPEAFYNSLLSKEIFEQIKKMVGQARQMLAEAEPHFVLEEPVKYYTLYKKDIAIVEKLDNTASLREVSAAVKNVSFSNLPRPSSADKEWEFIEEMKQIHNDVKDMILNKVVPLCIADEMRLFEENAQQADYLQVIFSLADQFGDRYFAEKQRRNLYDFSDMEHLALQLLVENYEQDSPHPSKTAKELQKKYRAIFVDEYQDTNLVQETLINMIHNPEHNQIFVVGDVKQSIYRFRQARPDLFLDRYEKYGKDNSENIRIELRDNFRSAPNVLHTTNLVFRQWMSREFGGIDYTEEIALRPGEEGPMAKETIPSEFLLFTKDKEEDEITDLEAEAFMIGRKIEALHEEGYEYRDMAILLRSAKEHAPAMAECLRRMNIPCLCDQQIGYFNTREISVIMSYLSVIDNVYQDIPMAAVMRSSIGGFTNEELAELKLLVEKAERRECYLYDLLKIAAVSEEPSRLREKAAAFLEQLTYFRIRKKEIPLHELLWEIYQKTGYFYEIMLYPGADEKKENMLMLIQKAQEYEKTVYKGLFYFMRYMEQLQTYEIDLSASASGESQEDAVRIMTIHKSKGLEFPIVFVSRLQGKFNKMDTSKPLLFHPNLGVGMDYVDLTYRISHPSFQKKAIKERIRKETLEEEMRILYVAMTRAKKKLILTGVLKEETLREKLKQYQSSFNPQDAACFLDWILASLAHHQKSGEHLFDTLNLSYHEKNIPEYAKYDCINIHLFRMFELHLEDILEENVKSETENVENYLERTRTAVTPEVQDAIKNSFTHQYPHKKTVEWKRKYSVSELKKLYQQANQIEDAFFEMKDLLPDKSEEEKTEPLMPAFLKAGEEEKISAVSRGTIVHKMLELLPLGKINTEKELFDALEQIKEQYPPMKKISGKLLYRYAKEFLFSEIGTQIRKYDLIGKVKKELPFTIGIPADMVYDAQGEEEFIVVQGIIDQCVETEDGLWLIDYKTDHVKKGEERVLLDRYQGQMLYYKTALEQITKKSVIKQLIYSFELAKFIEVN